MKMQDIPLCYYPSTVVLVDDDPNYLETIKLGLDQRIIFKMFSNPTVALEFINSNSGHKPELNKCVFKDEEADQDHLASEIDIQKINNIMYVPKRFSELSVVVSDHSMPGRTGLELLSTMHNQFSKKVMLTGEADNEIAVNAFNHKTIDFFIKKDDDEILDLINNTILKQQNNYFNNLSETAFRVAPDNYFSALHDPAFIFLFNQIVEEKNIVEYYITDKMGSFILLDADGRPYWLAITDKEGMEAQYYSAETEGLPAETLEVLKNHTQMFYFYNLDVKPNHWVEYCFPAQQLEGRQTYTYALIDNPHAFLVEKERLVSLNEFNHMQRTGTHST